MMDMRALYYIALGTGPKQGEDKQRYEEQIKANENFLNQNFTVMTQKLAELTARIEYLEGK
ncbi:MAG: hypothetical protein IJP37_05005 [Clostridia bacterium]|nr:hypothetical protein [Clostridia bacterium]